MSFSGRGADRARDDEVRGERHALSRLKPVMWSVVEKTALAEAEVEYEDYTSDTVWVKFPVRLACGSRHERRKMHPKLTVRSVVIWTTTPWTLPGNRAISYSPKIAYGLYEVTDAPADNWAKVGDKFILADKLAPSECIQAGKRDRFRNVGDVSTPILTV